MSPRTLEELDLWYHRGLSKLHRRIRRMPIATDYERMDKMLSNSSGLRALGEDYQEYKAAIVKTFGHK